LTYPLLNDQMTLVMETSRAEPDLSSTGQQLTPLLHHLVSCVHAPALALSDPDGQVRPGGVQGWFRGDRRLLSAVGLQVGGTAPEPLRGGATGAATASFTAVARNLDRSSDPTVRVDRERTLHDRRLEEVVTIGSAARDTLDLDVTVSVASDLAAVSAVRRGEVPPPVAPTQSSGGLVWGHPDEEADGLSVVLRCDPRPDEVDVDAGALRWRRPLRTGETLELRLTAEVHGQDAEFEAARELPWARPEVDGDVRVQMLWRRGLDDLAGLLLVDTSSAGTATSSGAAMHDHFLAAGTPWFLTLFGRDSIWAARLLLPLGTDLAMSTLRTLARRQGARVDPETEEQPGKILHEVRGEEQGLPGGKVLPPLYYGTVDATPLFVVLLAEAWHWGAGPEQVRALLPHAQACLRWMEEQAGEGFLRYVDSSGHGLTNQGWKDSDDGIQWADGRLARPPIALSEVQGYAYQAAVLGADLLDAFEEPGTQHWRRWATRLKDRFREAFWVEDDRGRYPAVALDADGRAVDSVASNMGHLLGTGLLDREEADLVATRLAGDDMDSGFGLRTLTSRSPRYSALSYHGGSVWPHDTAIAVDGLCREGHAEAAAALLRGLVTAAPTVDYRLPELYAGDPAGSTPAPAPYPTACRPQAWAAAAPVRALVAVLGVDVDVPSGVVRVPETVPAGLGALAVRGLRVGGHRLDLEVGADGRLTSATDHPDLDVRSVP
jgi:glycogen debranching enzyme